MIRFIKLYNSEGTRFFYKNIDNIDSFFENDRNLRNSLIELKSIVYAENEQYACYSEYDCETLANLINGKGLNDK